MSSDTIRVGIIGAGNNTRNRHIPGLQAIDGVEVVSVCNRSRESGQKAADQFGIAKVCDTWEDVVSDADVDAVVIGTWPYLHCRASCAALYNGKHVMVEARMAMNALEAHEMREAARHNPELVAQVVPSPFTLTHDAYIQQLVADGYLGDILAISVRHRGGFADFDSPMSWRQNFDCSGYNTLALGIYYEALARWVGHASSVVAGSKVCVKLRTDAETGKPAAVRIPDHLDIIADMQCGAQAHLQFSAVAGLDQERAFVLSGSKATLKFDLSNSTLYGGTRDDGEFKALAVPEELQGGWRVEDEFIGAIRGEEEIVLTDFEEGAKYMEFTEAVAQSAAEGKRINLPLL